MLRGLPLWLTVAAVVIAADQATKAAILHAFAYGDRLVLTPFFNLVLTFNSGAAFSFLAGAGGWQKWFFVVLALAISVWIVATLRRQPDDRLQGWALSLILGGALGNVIDRFAYGAVVDFLDFHWSGAHFPAFNVADSAISVGAALLVWDQLFVRKEDRA